MFDTNKFIKSTLMFFTFYFISILLLASGFIPPMIPSEYTMYLGLIVVMLIFILYILPISIKSYLLSLNNINHDIGADGCITIEPMEKSKLILLSTKYVYYLLVTLIGLLLINPAKGMVALLVNSIIALGSLLAFVELMPTTHNRIQDFAHHYKKTYLILLVLTALIFLATLQHFWF